MEGGGGKHTSTSPRTDTWGDCAFGLAITTTMAAREKGQLDRSILNIWLKEAYQQLYVQT